MARDDQLGGTRPTANDTARHGSGDPPNPSLITRRELLRAAGAAGAATLIPGPLEASFQRAAETAAAGRRAIDPSREAPGAPMINLTARETEILSAMVDRLIPSDDLGPGALEAGALQYIDRVLGEAESDSIDAYRAGIVALDRYCRESRGAPFIELLDGDRDSVLSEVETEVSGGAAAGFEGSSTAFFDMVKSHTWQGVFGDPRYGGNADFIGWDLIRYPGVRLNVPESAQQRLESDELEPVRRSAYEYRMFEIG